MADNSLSPTTTDVYTKLYTVANNADRTILTNWNENDQLNTELLDVLKKAKTDSQSRYESNKNLLDTHQSVLRSVQFVSDTQMRINRAMLEELDEVERQISVKDRLTRINQDSAQKKDDQIKVILASSTLLMIGIIALVGYLSGVLSLAQLGGAIIVLCLMAVLMVFFFRVNINKEFRTLEKDLGKLQKEIIREGDKLNQASIEWVDENCECEDADTDQKLTKEPSSDPNKARDDNIYYQDGSGPTHVIQLSS